MTIANAAVGLEKQLNMHPLEALSVVIPVTIPDRKVEPPHVHQNGHLTITLVVIIWLFISQANKLSLLIQ